MWVIFGGHRTETEEGGKGASGERIGRWGEGGDKSGAAEHQAPGRPVAGGAFSNARDDGKK